MKFQIGDIVRIKERQPKWQFEYPLYNHQMTLFENCIYEVCETVDYGVCIYLKEVGKNRTESDIISGYLWNANWLELVNEKPTGPILVFDDEEFLI